MHSDWEALGILSNPILETLKALKFTKMTPVQAAAIPLFMDRKDVAAEAVTGSGKTLAFLIPILEILSKLETPLKPNQVGALIISPTRELAYQISDVLASFLERMPHLKQLLFIGGSSISEDVEKFKKEGGNIIVATPGRMEDLLSGKTDSTSKTIFVQAVRSLEVLVLDEGDRLLSLGFEKSITTILAYLPKQRRTGLFSATQTKDLDKLVMAGLRNPVLVAVKDKENSNTLATPSTLQNYYCIVEKPSQKLAYLLAFLQQTTSSNEKSKCIVFFSTCACVEYFHLILQRQLKGVNVLAIHGKKGGSKRHKVFESFKKADNGLLICTDVMARGVDIPEVDWVLQFDPPSNAEAFVHRCGRTARSGLQGQALLFLLPAEEAYVNFIGLNQKVSLCRKSLDSLALPNIRPILQDWQKNDRGVFDLANRAFVSHIQSYSKHECKYILRLKDLPFGEIAHYFGLLRMPKMPELKKRKITGFQPVKNLDINSIKYKNKAKEDSRQEKLARFRLTGVWPGMKAKQDKESTVSWSNKVDKKLKRDERKRKKELKKIPDEMKDEISDDDLEEDYRLLKKAKKNNSAADAFDKQIKLQDGCDEDS